MYQNYLRKKKKVWIEEKKKLKQILAEMANTNGGFGKVAISAAGKFEKKSSNYSEERL